MQLVLRLPTVLGRHHIHAKRAKLPGPDFRRAGRIYLWTTSAQKRNRQCPRCSPVAGLPPSNESGTANQTRRTNAARSSPMVPPIISTNCRLIARPRPAPPYLPSRRFIGLTPSANRPAGLFFAHADAGVPHLYVHHARHIGQGVRRGRHGFWRFHGRSRIAQIALLS